MEVDDRLFIKEWSSRGQLSAFMADFRSSRPLGGWGTDFLSLWTLDPLLMLHRVADPTSLQLQADER